jgi:hypothetical protein
LPVIERPHTEVRKNFAAFFDTVYFDRQPVAVRREEQQIIALHPQLLREALHVRCVLRVSREKDDVVVYSIDELDLTATGASESLAQEALVAAARSYSERYIADMAYHMRSDRRQHLPFVLRVALADSEDEVRQILGLQPECSADGAMESPAGRAEGAGDHRAGGAEPLSQKA